MTGRRKIDDVLAEARRDLRRLTPAEADAAGRDGAMLVDMRSEDERRRQGALVPGALHHPLSVVHWRLDPEVPTRNPKLGFSDATDVIGGLEAWREAGLPLEPYPGAG